MLNIHWILSLRYKITSISAALISESLITFPTSYTNFSRSLENTVKFFNEFGLDFSSSKIFQE